MVHDGILTLVDIRTSCSNYEGFDFPVSGPYQEFPIQESGIYTGGKLKCGIELVGHDY